MPDNGLRIGRSPSDSVIGSDFGSVSFTSGLSSSGETPFGSPQKRQRSSQLRPSSQVRPITPLVIEKTPKLRVHHQR